MIHVFEEEQMSKEMPTTERCRGVIRVENPLSTKRRGTTIRRVGPIANSPHDPTMSRWVSDHTTLARGKRFEPINWGERNLDGPSATLSEAPVQEKQRRSCDASASHSSHTLFSSATQKRRVLLVTHFLRPAVLCDDTLEACS